jgi:AraC-like DNA-binding protein
VTKRSPVRSLITRQEIGTTANVVQHSTLRISQLALDTPALILLQHGKKTLQSGQRRWSLQGGEAIVLAGGQSFDVFNQLSAQGLFEARWLLWDKAVIEGFEHGFREARLLRQASVLRDVGREFRDSVDRAIEAISNAPQIPVEIARHRMMEVLVWLSLHDIALAAPQGVTMAASLRSLFAGSLSAPWTMTSVAARLAMSEATLRRRLSAEGVTYGSVLTDARMSFAMTLLQSTDLAVTRIASSVGYDSPSRFSVRFRARFGFAPTAVRGHRRAGT